MVNHREVEADIISTPTTRTPFKFSLGPAITTTPLEQPVSATVLTGSFAAKFGTKPPTPPPFKFTPSTGASGQVAFKVPARLVSDGCLKLNAEKEGNGVAETQFEEHRAAQWSKVQGPAALECPPALYPSVYALLHRTVPAPQPQPHAGFEDLPAHMVVAILEMAPFADRLKLEQTSKHAQKVLMTHRPFWVELRYQR